MSSNFSTEFIKIRKSVIDFVKNEYNNSGIVPSIRTINERFRISLSTYFPNSIKEVYDSCCFDFTPEENKKKSVAAGIRKKLIPFNTIGEGRNRILSYFRQQAKKGKPPTIDDIQRKFNISFLTYYPEGIKELYKLAEVIPYGRLRNREKLKNDIINYVRMQTKKDYYPTYTEIDERFNTNLKTIFSSIKELYQIAGIEYKRESNPFLKYKKEELLTKICKKLFTKLGYKIEKISIGPETRGGADIILKDSNCTLIPVEIKAYQKFGKIGNDGNEKYHYYFRNEIYQIKAYMKKMNSPYGFLVTSTNRTSLKKKPSNIRILFAKDIENLLTRYKLKKELNDLHWIRNSHVSIDKNKTVEKIRKIVLNYVKNEMKKGKYVTKREILRKFKIKHDTYFSSMKEIYEEIGIDPYYLPNARMGGRIDKEILKKMILKFVQKQAENGHYPRYKEIQKRFKCLPKLFFPGGIREIYELSGIKYKRKFARKTEDEKDKIRMEIVKFIKKRYNKGQKTIYRDILNNFHVDISNYFSNIREVHEMAGVEIGHRKGLRTRSSGRRKD